jgi:hypothetical protein
MILCISGGAQPLNVSLQQVLQSGQPFLNSTDTNALFSIFTTMYHGLSRWKLIYRCNKEVVVVSEPTPEIVAQCLHGEHG